jgi:hypothetical protein
MPFNQFRFFKQVLGTLQIAATWVDLAAEIEGAAEDAIRGRLLLEDVERWCQSQLLWLSGKNPFANLRLDEEMVDEAIELWNIGRRLGLRWREIARADSSKLPRVEELSDDDQSLLRTARLLPTGAPLLIDVLATKPGSWTNVESLAKGLGVSPRQIQKSGRCLREFQRGPLMETHGKRGYHILKLGLRVAKLLKTPSTS